MIKNINLIIISLYLNKYVTITKGIIFPFYYSINKNKNFTSIEHNLMPVISYYDKNIFYLFLEIGTPPLNLSLTLDDSDSNFIMKDDSCLFNNDYSIFKSSTFRYDQGLNYLYINYELKTILNNTKDKIYLNQIEEKPDKIVINDFNFLYLPNKEEIKQIHKYNNNINNSINFNPKCGYVGILPQELNKESIHEKNNFFYQLKKKNIIDNYYWFINYDENKKGEFIIGITPHEVYPDKFLEDDLYMTHAKLIDDKFIWQIHFSSIEILNSNSNNKINKIYLGNNNGIIQFSNNYIHCPKDYFDNITSIYFQKYLDRNMCTKNYIHKNNIRYNTIYCFRKNFTENELKAFPILILNCNELNFVFEFNYDDLFLKTDSIYIFKIIYNLDIDYWKFGNIFLEKYQFLFNYDTKLFGLYHHIYNGKNKNNKDNIIDKREKIKKEKNGNNYIKMVIIIGIIIFVIFLCIFILRKVIFYKKINSVVIENYNKF